MKRRVLYVSHNHPSVTPGGAETYALELYTAMRGSSAFEPVLLSRTGPPHLPNSVAHPGTALRSVNGDPNQYLFHTDIADFNWTLLANRRKQPCLDRFRECLETIRPDVVHFQHTLFFGADVLLATRQTLPQAPIVYTLHEYLPMCHRNGQLVRAHNDELCLEATPRRCHGCFPGIPEQTFFLRKRFLLSHFSRVDLFLAPSRFLLERHVDWGIPSSRIRYEDYGRLPMQPVTARQNEDERTRIGFFGQLTPYKGVTVLLEAMKILAGDAPSSGKSPHVWIRGSNIEFFDEDFQQKTRRLLAATNRNVTLGGRYEPSELPQLMADVDWVVVPSIWWENSPLVIQEAFAHGRPVICSNIGGMAEKVSDGVNGLHFRANDPVSLADTIRRATSTPGLWDRLRAGIPRPHAMPAHVATLEQIYGDLLEGTRPS